MRRKMHLAFITHKSTRKAALKKRRKCLMKKMDEVNTLCGVDGCAIIYSPDEAIPEVWPNEAKAESVVARFNMMPYVNRHKWMENQEVHFKKIISNLEGKLNKQRKSNIEKETTLLLYRHLNGEVSNERKLKVDEYHNLNRVIDQKLEEIGERMRAFSGKSALSSVQDSINPSRVNGDVAECSTSRMGLKDGELLIGIEEKDD
ncbi:agamous-like MADS-box protein AGL80 [Impatiens glandulifera]|uniref:agamous-like MADS-box protein AGL80 n=1 Tax=Impatiens glandulifera TaxID=253017 RepID=UPI001FB07188|nr:agamous-like MADS-box protein AGL80 [Impatiens glandulifera]